MSKSVKRNNKYLAEDYASFDDHQEHSNHLKEKKLRAALKSKNWTILQKLTEEEY
jgi:hypothetical protein